MFFDIPFSGWARNTDLLLIILDKENLHIEQLYRERFQHALPRPQTNIYSEYCSQDPAIYMNGDAGIRWTGMNSNLTCSELHDDKIIINFNNAAKILNHNFTFSRDTRVSARTLGQEFVYRFKSMIFNYSADMTFVVMYTKDLCTIIDNLVRICLNLFLTDEPHAHEYPSLQEILPKTHNSPSQKQTPQKNTTQTRKPQKKWRDQVITRDTKCQCCGFDKHLEAHHIYSYHDNEQYRDDPNNGITLCKFCHKKYHSAYGRDGANPHDLLEFLRTYGVIWN